MRCLKLRDVETSNRKTPSPFIQVPAVTSQSRLYHLLIVVQFRCCRRRAVAEAVHRRMVYKTKIGPFGQVIHFQVDLEARLETMYSPRILAPRSYGSPG